MALTPEQIRSIGPLQREEEEQGLLGQAGQFLKSNLDIPASIAGGVAGAAYGAPAGPVGMFLGGVAGGAAGTFGGAIASRSIDDGQLTPEEIRESTNLALTSAAIDTAFVGAGRVARLTGLTDAGSAALTRLSGAVRGSRGQASTAEKMAAQIPDLNARPDLDMVGTATLAQQAFEAAGSRATLTAMQTGSSGFFRNLGEGIARMGIISRGRFDAIDSANIQAVRDAADATVGGIFGSDRVANYNVGEVIIGALETGRKAATKMYGDSLEELKTLYGNKTVGLGGVAKAIEKFEKDALTDTGSALTDEALGVIERVKTMVATGKDLTNLKSSNLTGILNLNKQLSTLIADAGVLGANPSLRQQLMQLKESITPAIEKTVAKIDPEAAKAWKQMDNEYSTAINGINLTDMTGLEKAVTKAASPVQAAEEIGQLFTGANVGQAKTFMKGLEQSYNTAIKAAPAGSKRGLVKERQETIEAVRRGWMSKAFEPLNNVNDIAGLGGLGTRLGNTEVMAQAREIMGESYPDFQRLLFMMNRASKYPTDTGIFSLAFKSREATAIAQATAGVGAVVAGTSVGALMPAVAGVAAMLTLPSMLGRLATNRTAVKRLAALNDGLLNSNRVQGMITDSVAFGTSKLAQAAQRAAEQDMNKLESEAEKFMNDFAHLIDGAAQSIER